jgi:cell division inhibitor SulA/protein ImuA
MSADRELSRLLEHPAIWRGRSAARAETLPTGFAAFDARLPGNGWPRTGLIEILVSRFGSGELDLLLPALAVLTHRPAPRWCAWVAPPLEPFAPALAARGVALEHMLIIRASGDPVFGKQGFGREGPLWAFEQALGSGACDVAMAWIPARRAHPHPREIRRLQLAAERGRAMGILFRSRRAARESSPAVLRVVLEPAAQGVRITLLKSRGGVRGSIDLVTTAES